jgi:hypothetical protein
MVLLDRGQQYDPTPKGINWKGFIEFELYKKNQTDIFKFEYFQLVQKTNFITE